ncbi:GIY-YIG nuclease family protein [Geminocystis sp.]|uniref:GIY-YIG nuclease family protein n=1 Tax=Geminocystis sp. TaxID=2664100 RepID=UPI0035946276
MTNTRYSKIRSVSAVYGLLNQKRTKIYIGSTNNLRRRVQQHESLLKNRSHHNKELQEHYNLGEKIEVVVLWLDPLEDSETDNDIHFSRGIIYHIEGLYIERIPREKLYNQRQTSYKQAGEDEDPLFTPMIGDYIGLGQVTENLKKLDLT